MRRNATCAMGNVCCGGGNYEMLQRQELLKEGSEFKKKTTYLGVLSKTEHIYLQLNPSATRYCMRAWMQPNVSYITGHACGRGGSDVCGQTSLATLDGIEQSRRDSDLSHWESVSEWYVGPIAARRGVCVRRLSDVCGCGATGALEMVIFGSNGQKLLELTADSMSVRDLWVWQ